MQLAAKRAALFCTLAQEYRTDGLKDGKQQNRNKGAARNPLSLPNISSPPRS